jgi:hypothetical protein
MRKTSRAACALLAILVLLALPPPARERVAGFCEISGQVVASGGLSSTTCVQQSFPSCTVTAYFAGVAGGQNISTIIRSGNVVTGTLTSAAPTLLPGGIVTVAGVSDASLDNGRLRPRSPRPCARRFPRHRCRPCRRLEGRTSDLGRDALMAEVPPAMVSGSLRIPFLAVLPRDGAVATPRMTSRASPASRRAPSWAESRPGALDRFPTNFPTKRDDLVGLCSREHE